MKTCEKMEKSKIVMGILAAATLGACQSSKVKISGRLVGADARFRMTASGLMQSSLRRAARPP